VRDLFGKKLKENMRKKIEKEFLSKLNPDIRYLFEVVIESENIHWKCKLCGTRVSSPIDALYHATTHDSRLKRLIRFHKS